LAVAFGAFILFNYQNCAPAPSAGSPGLATDDSEVRVVDDWNLSKVQIFESYMQVESVAAEYTVEGFCERKMQTPLNWQLSSEVGLESQGETSCEGGGFGIRLAELQLLKCGELYQLSVSSSEGDADSAVFLRLCN